MAGGDGGISGGGGHPTRCHAPVEIDAVRAAIPFASALPVAANGTSASATMPAEKSRTRAWSRKVYPLRQMLEG